MKRFIRELRRREVFRTAGLYVGICWILIEVASVVLPTFDAPQWVIRAAVFVAFAGFPVLLFFAWVFDVSKEGIHVQTDPTDTIVKQLGARKTDFVVIGVLALALVVSLYLNVKKEASPEADLELVSVLVADFESASDDPSIEDLLEDALIVGIEVAPHITAYESRQALDLESALRMAQRDGISVLLTGSLQQLGSGYRVSVDGIDVSDGQKTFTVDRKAKSDDEVLRAIGNLSAMVREKLGDTTVGERRNSHAESYVAGSLEAARAYTLANQFVLEGKPEESVDYFKQAIALDPNFGRAVSGLALAEFTLGQTDEAELNWNLALSLMDTVTERERLRDLGRYYATVTHNDDKAVETYSELVDKYPADVLGHYGYAAASFRRLDFAKAIEEARKIVQIYPANQRYRTNLALYAMYNGDWETAANEAARVVAADLNYGTAYLPMAVAALAQGQTDASREAYRSMAMSSKTGHGASVAELGLADIDVFVGQIGAAQERLRAGIQSDIEGGNHRAAAVKYIALAQSLAEQENFTAASEAAAKALQLADDDALTVPTALIYIQSGDLASARAIAKDLTQKAHAHSRAYGQMLQGMILASEGERTEAVLALRKASSNADLWLIRYNLGKEYLRTGHYAEALDELTTTKERYGEATALYLDDMPTFRSLAELPYWMGRAQEALNIRSAARGSYDEYVALRPQGGALVQDAKERAAKLN